MAYDETRLTKLKALKALAEKIETRLDTLENGGTALKGVALSGNQLKFFTSTDTSTAATATIDLPAEQFLDATKTKFETNFTFSTTKYPNATNPNLDGKSVMVLGVKTKSNDGKTESLNYSFLDVTGIISDLYTAGDTTVEVAGNAIKVKVSSTAGNALSNTANGLYVDISGKADKVTGGTTNNFVALDANGNIKDSGYTVATDAEVTEMLNSILGN